MHRKKRNLCFLKCFNSQKHNIRHLRTNAQERTIEIFSILQGFVVSQVKFALLFTRITMGEFENANLHQRIDSKVQYLNQEKTSKEHGKLNSVQGMLLPLISVSWSRSEKKPKLISIRKENTAYDSTQIRGNKFKN